MIGLQEVSELVRKQTDIPYYRFFDYNIHRTSLPETANNEEKTNWRNMYWSINLLRILQMLTKHKSHRTMLMVQYKSAVSMVAYYYVLSKSKMVGNLETCVENSTSRPRTVRFKTIEKPSPVSREEMAIP